MPNLFPSRAGLLVKSVLTAPAAVALKLQFPLNFFLIFVGVIVFPRADRALQRY